MSEASKAWKLVISGDVAVGKTTLIRALTGETFSENQYAPTVTLDTFTQTAISSTNSMISYHLWDIPGNERYVEANSVLFHGTDVLLICHAMPNFSAASDAATEIQRWLQIAQAHTDPCVVIGVGTKCDLVSGDVESQIARQCMKLCDDGIIHQWYSTSCKEGIGIDPLLTYLLDEVPTRFPELVDRITKATSIAENDRSGGCC
jgi:small GTP-binding protein